MDIENLAVRSERLPSSDDGADAVAVALLASVENGDDVMPSKLPSLR